MTRRPCSSAAVLAGALLAVALPLVAAQAPVQLLVTVLDAEAHRSLV